MNLATPKRIIALIDLDCFYAQVEMKRNNIDKSIPCIVSQWNACIAVNYKAREYNISRLDNAKSAKEKCKELLVPHVDVIDANGQIYRYQDALKKWKTIEQVRLNVKVTLKNIVMKVKKLCLFIVNILN